MEKPGYDFQVYHGTVSPKEHLMDGLSGHRAYDNVAIDPFSSVAWSSRSDRMARLTVWDVAKDDVKISKRLKTGGINRRFTEEEKERHFESFRRNIGQNPSLRKDLLRPTKTVDETLEDEKRTENGLPGERLTYVVDFTEKQAKYLRTRPWKMQMDIIDWADSEVDGDTFTDMENDFLVNFPEPEKMEVVYDKGNAAADKRQILKKLFAQSLYANCLELVIGDNLNFSQEIIANLALNKVLRKPEEYYRGREFFYKLQPRLIRITDRVKAEVSAFYPEFKNLD